MDVPVLKILGYVGTIIGILGTLFGISWFFYRIRTQLDQHENHVKEMNSWKNETTKWKFSMIKYLRELAGRGQPTDIRQQNAELDELLIKSLPSNPITEEEKERFNNYRAMASSKKPFTSEEYNDFKLLADKFKTELPEETLGKFDNLMSEIFAFVLPVSIDKLESEQRIKSEKTKVRDMVLGNQISGHLSQNEADYFILKGIKANGELKIRMEASLEMDFELLVKYEILPSSSEWDFRGAITGPVKELIIAPTKSGNYYLMLRAVTGAGDFSLLPEMVGYYFLKTTSFFRADQQEKLQSKTNIQKPLYDIRAIVDTDIKEGLARVERVEYYLPAWPEGRRLQVKDDASDKFQLKELAFGSCYLKASVYLRDSAEPIEFTEVIQLKESGPRLLP